MTLKVGRTLDMTAASILAPTETNIFNCGILENDATAYSTGATYAIGDRAMDAPNHKVYECIQAHTPSKPPYVAANVGVGKYWLLVGSTNKWKIFDRSINSTVSDTLAAYQMYYVVGVGINSDLPAGVVNIGLFGVTGSELVVYANRTQGSLVNYAQSSEAFNASADWTPVLTTVTADTSRDPFLLARADSIFETVTASEKGMDSLTTRAYVSGSTYTISMYARQFGAPRNLRLTLPTAAFGASYGNFTLSGAGASASGAGAVTTSITKVTVAGIDWYRCSVTKIATANVTAIVGSFRILDAALSATYTGDITTRLMVFGFQNNDGNLAAYQAVAGGVWFDRVLLKYIDYTASAGADALFATDVLITDPSYVARDRHEVYIVPVGTKSATIGEMVYAYESISLGELIEPTESGFLDFSVKQRDDFGNLTLIERNFADDTNYQFEIQKADRQRVKNVIRKRRASRLLFWLTEDPENTLGLMSYSFLRGYTMPALGATTNYVTLDTEGI